MEKNTKTKICKTCMLKESDTCTFDYNRLVCRKCRYLSKINVQHFKDNYQIHKSEILQLKATNYKNRKNELVL